MKLLKWLTSPLRWLKRIWDADRREIDLDILWPMLREHGRDLDHARQAFLQHMAVDDAYEGMTKEEVGEFVRTKLV